MILSQFILIPKMDKEGQAAANNKLNELLQPYKITKVNKQEVIDSTWDLLRCRRS